MERLDRRFVAREKPSEASPVPGLVLSEIRPCVCPFDRAAPFESALCVAVAALLRGFEACDGGIPLSQHAVGHANDLLGRSEIGLRLQGALRLREAGLIMGGLTVGLG